MCPTLAGFPADTDLDTLSLVWIAPATTDMPPLDVTAIVPPEFKDAGFAAIVTVTDCQIGARCFETTSAIVEVSENPGRYHLIVDHVDEHGRIRDQVRDATLSAVAVPGTDEYPVTTWTLAGSFDPANAEGAAVPAPAPDA